MQEIEVKFLVKDFRPIREKLLKLGSVLIWKGREETFFFDTVRHDLGKSGKHLRLREWEGKLVSLTAKGPVQRGEKKYKIRTEQEINVSDVRKARKLLELVGFRETLRYYKFREHWKIENAFVELDRLAGKNYVEIEGAQTDIKKVALLLGLESARPITKGYVALLEESRRMHAKR